MFTPATIAPLTRIPCPVNGWGKGVRIEMDELNGKVSIIDEEGNYPQINLPAILAPFITAPGLYVEDGYGWEIDGTSLICKINYIKMIEITSASIMYFNILGNKMIHIDLDSGNIYTRGVIKANGIDFP